MGLKFQKIFRKVCLLETFNQVNYYFKNKLFDLPKIYKNILMFTEFRPFNITKNINKICFINEGTSFMEL